MMSLPAPKPSQSRRILENRLVENRPQPTSSWSLNFKETRIQDERYKEKDTNIDCDAEAWQASYSQWNNWHWEDAKAASEKEEMIQRTKEVLRRHRRKRRKAPVQVHLAHRSGKRGRSPLPWENMRMGQRRQGGKASSKRAKAAGYAMQDDKKILTEVDVAQLRYSQLSIKPTFQCGRSVVQLVKDLWDGKVKVCAPFLQLSVFETTDHTGKPILRCIDNRRLYALKQYALLCDDPIVVTVNFFSESG